MRPNLGIKAVVDGGFGALMIGEDGDHSVDVCHSGIPLAESAYRSSLYPRQCRHRRGAKSPRFTLPYCAIGASRCF